MPRTSIGPINANGTGLLYHPALRSSKPIRIRDARIFVVAVISGGANFTCQLGYSPSGAEIVASHTEVVAALDAESSMTIANAVVPPGKIVCFNQTATSRTAGVYFVLLDWDNDY